MQRKPVSYWRLIRRLKLYWLGFPLVFALAFGGVGIALSRDVMLLAREGVVVQAQIIDRQIETRRSSDGKTSTYYHVHYSYHPEERADPITRRQTVSRTLYDRAQPGGQMPVTYAWSSPDRASIDLAHDRLGAWIFGGIGVVAALVSLGLGGWMIGRKRSVLRALRHGELREARVTGIRETNVRKNNVRQYVLDWVDATGATGSSMMDRFTRLSETPVGSVIRVYVDPRTGRGWWEDQV